MKANSHGEVASVAQSSCKKGSLIVHDSRSKAKLQVGTHMCLGTHSAHGLVCSEGETARGSFAMQYLVVTVVQSHEDFEPPCSRILQAACFGFLNAASRISHGRLHVNGPWPVFLSQSLF